MKRLAFAAALALGLAAGAPARAADDTDVVRAVATLATPRTP